MASARLTKVGPGLVLSPAMSIIVHQRAIRLGVIQPKDSAPHPYGTYGSERPGENAE